MTEIFSEDLSITRLAHFLGFAHKWLASESLLSTTQAQVEHIIGKNRPKNQNHNH